MLIKDEYSVYVQNEHIGTLYVFSDGTSEFRNWLGSDEQLEEILLKAGSPIGIRQLKRAILRIIRDRYRVKERKRIIYENDVFTVERQPWPTEERYSIYRRQARESDPDYDSGAHEAPHFEGAKTPEGMMEWANWYAFVKMDDGTCQAQLDEAWNWGGSHYDGGTISVDIPEDWFELPYDDFLDKVVTLAAASHYEFTADFLRNKKGLREFFGFEEDK